MFSKPGTTTVTLIFVMIIAIVFIAAPMIIGTMTIQNAEQTQGTYNYSLQIIADAIKLLMHPVSLASLLIVIVVIIIYRKLTKDREEYME